jgi:type IV pilus assembly protein PilN
MTKINLLLVRGDRKKEALKKQVFIVVVVLAASLAVCMMIYLYVLGEVSFTKDEIARSEAEIQQLKSKIGQIENLKKLQEEVRKKLDVLNQLRSGKTGPVKRLAALSDVTPEKLWLTRYSENGDSVSLGGIAYTEELIADFMRNLEASREFSQVELQVSEQVDIAGVKAKRFEIACKLAAPKKEETKPQPQK